MNPWVLLVVGLVVGAVLVWVLRRPGGTEDANVQALRNDVNILRETTDRSLQQLTSVFGEQLRGIGEAVQTSLASVRGELGQRLNENVNAMTTTTREVNDRMARVQDTFAGLQKQVGEMSEQARQLAEMSKSMAELEQILSSPKLRGGFGEAQLDTLLSMVFARDQYALQYEFPTGDRVDAIILFPQGKVAIDAKFSLDNFRRIAAAENDADRKNFRREFLKDSRKRIDEIAGKYIRPADGTLPFALMYVPAENVYYEAIIRDEDGNDLYSYCLERHVFPVSPNSLYAYLQTIMVGLQGMRVSERARAILDGVKSFQTELKDFAEMYGVLGKHLKNAGEKYADTVQALNGLQTRVRTLAAAEEPEPARLETEGKRVLDAG